MNFFNFHGDMITQLDSAVIHSNDSVLYGARLRRELLIISKRIFELKYEAVVIGICIPGHFQESKKRNLNFMIFDTIL